MNSVALFMDFLIWSSSLAKTLHCSRENVLFLLLTRSKEDQWVTKRIWKWENKSSDSSRLNSTNLECNTILHKLGIRYYTNSGRSNFTGIHGTFDFRKFINMTWDRMATHHFSSLNRCGTGQTTVLLSAPPLDCHACALFCAQFHISSHVKAFWQSSVKAQG